MRSITSVVGTSRQLRHRSVMLEAADERTCQRRSPRAACGPGTDISSNAGDGTAVHLSAPGTIRHDVAHQVAHVALQISDDVLDDVSNRDHAHDLASVQHR